MIHKIIIPTPFPVGDVNSFLLKGDALSLIDAGPRTPEAYEAIQHGIKEAGYTLDEIEQVILTHHHPDHAGWIDAFDHAKVLGHAYNHPYLTRDEAFLKHHDEFYYDRMVEEGVPDDYLVAAKKMRGTLRYVGERPLDILLKEGDELPGHHGWTVLETLGHAQSHIALWEEETGKLIGGDLVLEKVSSNPIIEPPLDPKEGRPRSLLQYNQSLKRLLDLPIEVIYSGHGNEVRGVHDLIKTRFAKQHERAMNVWSMLSGGPRTVFELTRELFPTVYQKELGLTLSETIGQTDYLLEQGLIREYMDENGLLQYEQA
ncbi:metallo-beta-lactamase superfamily domain protein [Bacillus sp. OxB-1]|uniref:MBL fold metallo-hydrolase n=1 Tax=Bacillus sp. (strain OxB-1) TaxID=98228 RepID=UPI0005822AE9|nr:MBL fold metallo-hydrolase [Bacillus sp. OxB-1]BAQ11187.1 metallo-beta-lactamase superfamily domain protein [Bacillus sp. OxB-1]